MNGVRRCGFVYVGLHRPRVPLISSGFPELRREVCCMVVHSLHTGTNVGTFFGKLSSSFSFVMTFFGTLRLRLHVVVEFVGTFSE